MGVDQGSGLATLTFAILAILLVFLAAYVWRSIRLLSYFSKNNVPYRRPLPVFGNMWPVVFKQKSFAQFFHELYQEYPEAKYSGTFEFSSPVYLLRDPELIKIVTVKYFDHFPDHKPFVDESTDKLFGGNLFSIKGERWKEMRSIVSPVFTSSKMRTMFELMSKCAQDVTQYLEKQPQPLTLEMKELFTRYTNDVIATTAFGISVNSLESKENEFYMMGKNATTFTGLRALKMFLFNWNPALVKFLRLKLFPRKVTDFFSGLVSDTVTTREREGITRPDLIHLLMQARHKKNDEKLSIDEITAQSFIFFFAGFDTSSTLMSFACHQLALHPEIQDKLIAEIDAVFDEADAKGEVISYEQVKHLNYLEMVLNETLRYYPPGIVTDRVNVNEFELPPATEGGKPVLLKPGDRVWIPVYALHHDAQYFPDPEKFDPERFSPENKGNVNPFAFLPFGVGPRNCPANRFALLETKLVLCTILRKFHIRVGAKTHVPLVLSTSVPAMTSKHGFWLDFEPRSRVTN